MGNADQLKNQWWRVEGFLNFGLAWITLLLLFLMLERVWYSTQMSLEWNKFLGLILTGTQPQIVYCWTILISFIWENKLHFLDMVKNSKHAVRSGKINEISMFEFGSAKKVYTVPYSFVSKMSKKLIGHS